MPCTTILVGKKASYDGSTIVARNEDSANGEFNPKRFCVVDPEGRTSYTSKTRHLTVPLPAEDGVRYTAVPNADLSQGLWEEAGFSGTWCCHECHRDPHIQRARPGRGPHGRLPARQRNARQRRL